MSAVLLRARLPLAAALAVLVALSGLVALAGARPGAVLAALVEGVVGDRYVLAEAVVGATPLALVALGVMAALRAGVFTIGSEGQLVIGAILATGVALAQPAPGLAGIALAALAGMLGGMAWALGPALARAWLGANEILSTLLMNYIAGFVLLMVLRGPLRGDLPTATPQSNPIPAEMRLSILLEGTRLHAGALAVLAIAALALVWSLGRGALLVRLHATHPALALRLGLSGPRAVVMTMLVAGAAAGLAGMVQVLGLSHTLYASVGGGLGFTGIIVAFLGGLHPLGIVLAALAFGALITGADGMQMGTGVPASLAVVVQGLALLAVAVVLARAPAPSAPTAPTPEAKR